MMMVYKTGSSTEFIGDYDKPFCRDIAFNKRAFHQMGQRDIFHGSVDDHPGKHNTPVHPC